MAKQTKSNTFKGKIAIIPGGSKGMGKATAKEFVSRGGSVCIIARDRGALAEAASEISAMTGDVNQFVETISADTTRIDELEPQITSFVNKHGTPDFLLNFVGYAYPQYLGKLTLDDFKKIMDTNYYGQLVPTLILLPYFMKEKKGHIVICSSALGFMGILGYTAYCPTKYALSGFAESMRHELKPHGIRCSVLFPPDTDTPGFAQENMTKPVEVAIMSESGGLLQPEQVAECLMKGIIRNRFYILPGETGLLWRVSRHFPKLMHRILDSEYKKAVKKAARSAGKIQ